MKEILLIVALVIAIYLDIVRIYQYIRMRKLTDKAAEDAFFGKMYRIYERWFNDKEENRPFIEYLREHWKEEE